MNSEKEFAQKIEEIKTMASLQGGFLKQEQIEEAFAEIGMSGEMLAPVYDFLKAKNIGIGERLSDEEILSNEDMDYLNMYTESLLELPDLTDGEKRAVYMSAMAGERDAKRRLIEIMLSDVVDMAKLYTGQGVLIEDLIGEGNVALTLGVEMLGALETPDEVPGMLAKMAMDAMEELISQELNSKKADDKLVEKVNKIADAAKELSQDLGRKVTVEELAAEGKFSKKAIEDAIRVSGKKIEDIE